MNIQERWTHTDHTGKMNIQERWTHTPYRKDEHTGKMDTQTTQER